MHKSLGISTYLHRRFRGCTQLGYLIITLGMIATARPVGAIQSAKPSATRMDLATIVPDSCHFFVQIHRLSHLNRSLERSHAWPLLSFLNSDSIGPKSSEELYELLETTLGFEPEVERAALNQIDIALAAPSLSKLDEAVWLLHVSDTKLLDRWFPQQKVQDGAPAHSVRLFMTRSGFRVALHDDVLAIGRQWGPKSLLMQVVSRMTQRREHTLRDRNLYQQLASHLPPSPLAVIYLSSAMKKPLELAKILPLSGPMRGIAISIHEEAETLSITIRGMMDELHHVTPLSEASLDRFARLPITTVLAWAMKLDTQEIVSREGPAALQNARRRFAGWLRAVMAVGKHAPSSGIGEDPHALFIWGQDLREDRSSLQAAFMVESDQGPVVVQSISTLAERLIRITEAFEHRIGPSSLQVTKTAHLGIDLYSVSLREYSKRSKRPIAQILASVEPTWAYWNGWVVFALSQDHLKRILDAQLGIAPGLSYLRDFQSLIRGTKQRTLITYAQPGMGSELLDVWVVSMERGETSLLDTKMWNDLMMERQIRHSPLGIGMRIKQDPGRVVVVNVYPGTVADGRLHSGDQIIGMDHELLSLNAPNSDLRLRWLRSRATPGPTLRVIRDGRLMDVTLIKKLKRDSTGKSLLAPVEALKEMTTLGHSLRSVSYHVLPAEDRVYAAKLTIRFNNPN